MCIYFSFFLHGQLGEGLLGPSSGCGASLVAQTVKNPSTNAGDADLIPGLGRFPGEGSGNPLQYSCLRNPMNRGACGATVHVMKESDLTQ